MTRGAKPLCAGFVQEEVLKDQPVLGYFRQRPCRYTGVLKEEGQWWCRVHAPSEVARREAKRETKREESNPRRLDGWEIALFRRQAQAGAVLAGYIRATMEVCGTILPRSVLDAALAEFPE